MKEKILIFLIGMLIGTILLGNVRAESQDRWTRYDIDTIISLLQKIADK